MGLNLEPVKVSIEIDFPSLAREAFYNICFITENEKAPRTLKVERLRDLLDNGYDRSSLAYNFCVGVFAQQGIPTVYVRAKRSVESYSDAFSADDNSNYYFVVIESKELYEISDFNQYLSSVDENKLQFYSNSSHEISEISRGKIVNYYQEFFDFSDEEDYYLNKAYKIVTSHNYSSKPYPALVEKQDGYTVSVTPEDFTLREVLKERFFGGGFNEDSSDNGGIEGYTPSVTPLDILLESAMKERYIDPEEAYIPSVTPLDIVIRNLLKSTRQDPKEAHIPSVKPLDITKLELLVEQWVDESGAYIPSVKPLDITLK